MGYVAQQAQICLIQSNLLKRGQYNSLSKHFFAEVGLIQHCEQEGLQPSIVALINAACSLAQKVSLLCIDLSSMAVDALAINQCS